MNKQTIAVIVGAVVLFAVAVVGALAFTGGDSGAGSVHTMSNGQMMSGATHAPSGMGSMMGGHTMTDGEMMPGMDHTTP